MRVLLSASGATRGRKRESSTRLRVFSRWAVLGVVQVSLFAMARSMWRLRHRSKSLRAFVRGLWTGARQKLGQTYGIFVLSTVGRTSSH